MRNVTGSSARDQGQFVHAPTRRSGLDEASWVLCAAHRELADAEHAARLARARD